MAKKKSGGLLKNMMRSMSKTVDSAVKYLVKHPISIKGKEVSATVGGKMSKADKDFVKSGKKFKITTKNGRETLVEI